MPDQNLLQDIKKADLRFVSDQTPGITRKRQGNNFLYFEPNGDKVRSKTVLQRIQQLVIPPAWENVWISPSPTGYLQATGQDNRKRKQYIYHPAWKAYMQENKFNKMVGFADVLPKIRNRIQQDMESSDLDKDKIIATVVWLLEHTLIRIGNDEYAKENNSYGLTTLRNKHVKIHGKEIAFDFRGKSGVEHTVSISNPKIARIIKECVELPGYEIFQYVDDNGIRRTVDSSNVNEYLKAITNSDITAKEFRTWGGTVLGGETLFKFGNGTTEQEIKKYMTDTVKKVSQHLRNTVAVCRQYYIHPTIFETYQKNILVPHFAKEYANFDRNKTKLSKSEYATLTLLEKYS